MASLGCGRDGLVSLDVVIHGDCCNGTLTSWEGGGPVFEGEADASTSPGESLDSEHVCCSLLCCHHVWLYEEAKGKLGMRHVVE